MVDCPLACVDSPSWLERHESFILTLAASGSAMVSVCFAYFLKSRCTSISVLGCVSCDRNVLPPDLVTIESSHA